ncbi:MAG: BON domain-containing protein [Gammaproteobacteria bacterium]|nr:BON domain-containing protein [Gammaproteobacteria bacterium]MDH5594392.1 BON domain-containing protein [Gammaproteobacteria bacterium]MDH5614463.1 BON domain-containing protein [Gammaproteobacteria bacterium]
MITKGLVLSFIILLSGLLNGCAEILVTSAATGAVAAHDRRSVGTFVDDETIELKAREQWLSDSEMFDKSHINFTSINRVVLITGEAPTVELRDRIVSMVKNITSVRRVHNEVQLSAPSSLITRSGDTYITSKVKIQIFRIDNLDATRVKVVTENGVVYLMGLVTRDEGYQAADAASKVSGVQRVVKIFEYID